MAASRTEKSTRSREAKDEASPDLEALMVRIQGYLTTSKTPEEDWQLIQDFVEEGLRRPLGREVQATEHDRSQGVKDEPMLESKSGSSVTQQIKSAELFELLHTVVDDPEKWLLTPTVQFGGRKPSELVGTAEESKIFDLLHAVDQGFF